MSHMEATPLSFESEESLRFIGEGNEHLVFAVTGSDDVLRFRKYPREEEIRREELLLQVSDDISFINDVARPLAGPLLLDEARLVAVDPGLMGRVMAQILPLRDEKRLFKVINPFGIGILTPNVATKFIARRNIKEIRPRILNLSFKEDVIGISSSSFYVDRFEDVVTGCITEESQEETHFGHEESQIEQMEESQSRKDATGDDSPSSRILCIELKPKQGCSELGPRGNPLCRFCLKQNQKLASKTEAFRSEYCPRDLFSGDALLMKKAVQNLFAAPQNNFKIFKGGKRILDLEEYKHLSELIVRILTYDATCNGTGVSNQECSSPRPETEEIETEKPKKIRLSAKASGRETPLLPQGSTLSPSSFLGKILYLQSLGGIAEVQAAAFYREMSARIPCKETLHKSLTDFKFLKKEDEEEGVEFEGELSTVESSVLCQLLQQCLITMSAKDASLMMLIDGPHQSPRKRANVLSPFWLEFPLRSGSFYQCQVSLVDVALKWPEKILQHEIAMGELEDILIDLAKEGKEPPCTKRKGGK